MGSTPMGPVAHALNVMLEPGAHLVAGSGIPPAAVDLRAAGDAGLDLVAQHVALDEMRRSFAAA